ncbi:MAG: hypothetical protein ACUVTL_03390 [Thermoproteota archaeon]
MAKVNIRILTTILDQKGKVALEADSIEDALKKIVEKLSRNLKIEIIDEQGRSCEFIDIVNGKNVDLLNGLKTRARDGDRNDIIRVVSGG